MAVEYVSSEKVAVCCNFVPALSNASLMYAGMSGLVFQRGAITVIRLYDLIAKALIQGRNIWKLTLVSFQDIANEVNILSSMEHPNIIRFYDCFYTDNHVMITMEYATKGNLAEYMYQRYPKLIKQQVPMLYSLCHLLLKLRRNAIGDITLPWRKGRYHTKISIQTTYLHYFEDFIKHKVIPSYLHP